MLRIEKVFLQGFKSFCDPTEVVYDEEGITAVVGPNGCGKSNIADAISWVIGEQRPKALRGGKMEDVIFQGSRNRPPSGMAEVTLTMAVRETFEVRAADNGQAGTDAAASQPEGESQTASGEEGEETEAELPAEPAADAAPAAKPKKRRRRSPPSAARVFQEGERITVTRRLYRTGESEYAMNGRTCRLRDIQDLFAGTGLGGAHYAIIEQGRIGQVLSAKPLDRRALIEEAAGISKFKMRQRAAELKLEAAKQNLARIHDIITEVERQQNSLKRQAGRARRYRRLRQEMRDLMRAVYVADYRATRDHIAALTAQRRSVTERESQLLALITHREGEQAQAAQAARAAEERLNHTRQQAAQADLEAERAQQQHARLDEQLQSLGARATQFERDRAAINERSTFIEQESRRLRAELAHLEQEIQAEGAALQAEENRHRAQMNEDAGAERELEVARRSSLESATHLERWRQLQRQFAEAVERSEAKLRGLAAERARALGQAQTAAREQARIAAQIEERARERAETGQRLQEITAARDEQRRASAARQTSLASLHRDLTAAEHRLQSLIELDERRAYFSEAVQTVMSRARQGEHAEIEAATEASAEASPMLSDSFCVLGTLADFLHAAPEHEAMIEAGLRDELQYLLVPAFDDALRAMDFLQREGRGRATFLVVGLHGAGSRPVLVNSEPDREPERPDSAAPDHFSHTAPHQAADDTSPPPPPDEQPVESGFPLPPPSLISLLGLRPEISAAFQQALPALAEARIVQDAARAIELSAQRNGHGPTPIYLARTGERAVAGRLISGGSAAETGMGVLALKREIAELSQRAETLAATVSDAEAELAALTARITQLEEQRTSLDGQLRRIEQQLAVAREQAQQCERERERLATYLRVVEQETAQAAQERTEAEAKREHAAMEAGAAEAAHQTSEQALAAAQTALAGLRQSAEQRAQELSRRRADFAAKTERRRGLQNDLRRLDGEADDLQGRLNRSRFESLEADEQAQAAQAARSRLAAQLETLAATREERAAELERQTAALTSARAQLEALERELRERRETASQLREERAQLDIEQARLSAEINHIIESCRTELGENIVEVCDRLEQTQQSAPASPPAGSSAPASAPDSTVTPTHQRTGQTSSELEPGPSQRYQTPVPGGAALEGEEEEELLFWQVPEEFDLAAAKARLAELRAKIEALGPVNMMALEEIDQVAERWRFLSAQRSDLEKAIADTQAAIAEIKRRSRERFREAFQAVNANFALMFQELFGGGHGEMRLIDETDLLESGIEIIAQPPGKRLQNILLLSGGEKAMAAMALVLAIFKYRPSPFCLLDEVDAPLDEVNIGRFVEKVMEMSYETQFMLITHNKRTMEAAQTLYGVTMEDPGVSKLVSVRLT
jgi:chromosome segregation protein